MNKEQEMILRDAYDLIYNYTDDMGWCNVCESGEAHKPNCEKQIVLNQMKKLFPDIFCDYDTIIDKSV